MFIEGTQVCECLGKLSNGLTLIIVVAATISVVATHVADLALWRTMPLAQVGASLTTSGLSPAVSYSAASIILR